MSDYRRSGAYLSIDHVYRYHLWREWNETVDRRMCFVMLNPSTADGLEDDPTIRRCIGFAKREGCQRLDVVNLFAYRATDPKALIAAHKAGEDIVGPSNYNTVIDTIEAADIVVLAWGAKADEIVIPMLSVDSSVDVRYWLALASASLTFYRLGTKTKSGAPRHPLYLASDTPLEVW